MVLMSPDNDGEVTMYAFLVGKHKCAGGLRIG
jgi:hypothetical protein